jgi:hypothetical protein
VTRHADALEAGVGVLEEKLAVTRAAMEYLAPGTYEDDLRYNARLIRPIWVSGSSLAKTYDKLYSSTLRY